ncbi:MAG: hypothetical protein BGO34_20295 [Bacteroidia bacterium 44-10]|nr:MAG: hypothetical protein BGO34_20295 [Bacteroidia bacterium 44-10]
MNEEERAVIEELVESCFVFDLLPPIKQIVKEIKRKYKIKLPDAIVAVTAVRTIQNLPTRSKKRPALPVTRTRYGTLT